MTNLLTQTEEMIMVTVWSFQNSAYCVPIRNHLNKISKKEWSLGAVYDSLERLERKGYLMSNMSEPSGERGGRSKRLFKLTAAGKKTLVQIRRIQETLWMGIEDLEKESR
ncbi:MAG: PadR family transcriptional regulator [Candidatus Aminicenantes bacterium]|nr:PadR family transcriptional regulator [Candidatus Aminicenantes bacterium]